jgi:hypothetical protein
MQVTASKYGKDLHPDGNRADEQRNRCKRRSFFDYCTEHVEPSAFEHRVNIVHYLFDVNTTFHSQSTLKSAPWPGGEG